MTQTEAALGTLLLIAIVVAIQCWVSMRVARREYEELWQKVVKAEGLIDRYERAWKKARTP